MRDSGCSHRIGFQCFPFFVLSAFDVPGLKDEHSISGDNLLINLSRSVLVKYYHIVDYTIDLRVQANLCCKDSLRFPDPTSFAL